MDDRLQSTISPAARQQEFLCPGQSRPIERAVHLARLAAFDPTCLACPLRHDTAGLHSTTLAWRTEIERRASAGWEWTDEALVTSERGKIDRELPTQFAYAIASLLTTSRHEFPCVHVGSSGAPAAAELLAVVCRAFEFASCDTCEVGAVTAPCLASGVADSNASGGVWIGNVRGGEHELAMVAYGGHGQPWSLSGRLNDARRLIASGVPRRRRTGGRLRRFDAETRYLHTIRDAFHGLRPLGIVLHTASRPLLAYWRELSRDTALKLYRLDEHGRGTPANEDAEPLESEVVKVAREVILTGAHLGFWIDGAGERCELIDEQGRRVPHRRLARLLNGAISISAREPLLPGTDLRQPSREQFGGKMLEQPQPLMSDGLGRYWFAGRATPDALAVICSVLTLLSRSDWPLSEVLDAEAPDE